MVHSTPARKEAKGLKQRADEITRESKTLEGIEGASPAGRREAS
jgi:hypothetical protein